MTPDELAKSNTEHGHQRAFFAWCRMAEKFGFAAAWSDEAYSTPLHGVFETVPELSWIHAIPNGGLRDKATAAKLKSEGVKRGIPDVFLPLPMKSFGSFESMAAVKFCGLYIEFKKPETKKTGKSGKLIIDQRAGQTSDDQDGFIMWARRNGYAVGVYFDWRSAAIDVQKYVEEVRRNS